MNNDITFVHPLYLKHQEQVKLCNDLYNGYDTAKAYLVQPTNETNEDYANRVEMSDFNNVFERIIVAQVGQIYRKPIVNDEVPEPIIEWLDEIKLEESIKDATTMGNIDGKGFVLIDLPTAGGDPYLINIPRSSLINWRTNGKVFTMAVIRESYADEDGFKIEYKEQYRHIKENGDVDIWREVEGSGFQIVESITTSYDFLPLYMADFSDIPPLYNIAVMNKILYNHDSSMGGGLYKVGMPTMLTKMLGLDDDDEIKYGTNYTVNSNDIDADMKWVELEGTSIPVYQEFIKSLETTIGERALDMQGQTLDSNKTATQVNKENSESNARLSDISSIMETFINEVYQGLIRIKYKQDATGEIQFAYDFKDEGIANNLMPSITAAWTAGLISQKTALTTLVEKEQILIEDIEEEIKQAQLEFIPEVEDEVPASNNNTK